MYLNGERLPVKSFQEYVDLYLGPKDTGPPRWYERFSDRWEVCISPSDGQFNQVRAGGEVEAPRTAGGRGGQGAWLVPLREGHCASCQAPAAGRGTTTAGIGRGSQPIQQPAGAAHSNARGRGEVLGTWAAKEAAGIGYLGMSHVPQQPRPKGRD